MFPFNDQFSLESLGNRLLRKQLLLFIHLSLKRLEIYVRFMFSTVSSPRNASFTSIG